MVERLFLIYHSYNDKEFIIIPSIYRCSYLAVLLPVFPLALSSFKVLLFNNGFSKDGLVEGLVVSAGCLLWPAEEVVFAELVTEVDAGLFIAPLYRLKNDEAADVAVVSIAWRERERVLYSGL